MRLNTRRLLIAAALCAAPASLAAQDYTCDKAGDVEVRKLSFAGNRSFRSGLLRNSINTESSSLVHRWFRFFGTKRCLDKLEFVRDSVRLLVFYQKSGYYDVSVKPNQRTLSKTAVAIEFTIHEGEPTIVTELSIAGLDSVAERAAVLRKLALREGDPFDLDSLAATIYVLRRRLRDTGYPAAEVLRTLDSTDKIARRATVRLTVEPGTRAHLGVIELKVTPRDSTTQQIPDAAVRRLLGLRPGDLYRETKVEFAKRNLILTQAYRGVTVDVDSNEVRPPGDSVVTIHVTLAEGLMRSARASGGWGTLDCFRTEGEYHDLNFAHSAWRFDLSGRLSKIGIGKPLSGAAPLCRSELRHDPYSTRLNYYLGSTFTAPNVIKFGMQPSLTVFGERRSEFNAYVRTTRPGAVLSATRISTTRRMQTVSYQLEYGRTEAQPAIFCALQNLCLPEDRDPLLANRRLAVAGWLFSQDWSDDPQNPSQGGVGRLELRHASSAIGSDASAQFSKGTADVALYFGLGRGFVLSPRVRVGAVVGPSFIATSTAIPQQERLFAGGANTVRGFRQNDLGPKVYIAPAYDTVRASGAAGLITPDEEVFFRVPAGVNADRSVPTGGSALVVANLELRMPSPFLSRHLYLSAFVDAGELWSPGATQAEDRFHALKVTPGIGFRIGTALGALGIDVAYNGYQPRAGAAFFDTPVSDGGQLYCVSPGNSLPVTGLNGSHVPAQAVGPCARDFQPPSIGGFARRLRFTFGLGQAY